MKSLISIIIVFVNVLASQSGFSQNVAIIGSVSDTLHHALPYANIQIFDESDNVATYAIANEQGEYSLTITKAGNYKVKAGSLGYFPTEQKLNIQVDSPGKMVIDFILLPNPEMLKEVVVSKDVAARVRPDTVTYTVGKYLSGNEKVLKDVLNKLPGIEVQDNGKVKAYGKDVDKILVEGEDFFFDQQKMAVENLTADAVSQVQVLSNYQPNSLQKDFSQGGQTYLNINVKDEFREKISGNLSAAGGYKNKYLGNFNLYQFGRKLKAGLIANANNTGEETFSMHDYMSFGGSIEQLMENNDNSSGLVQINSGDMPSGIGGGNDASRKNTALGALNMNYKWNEKLKFNSSVIASSTNRNDFENIKRSFFAGGSGISQSTFLNSSKSFFLGNFNLSLNYKPKSNMSMLYRINAGLNTAGSITDIENQGARSYFLNENQELQTSKIVQYLDFSYKITARSFLNVGLFHEYRNKSLTEILFSDSSFLGLKLSFSNRVKQELTSGRKQYGLNTSYSYKLGKTILKNISGISIVDQPFSSGLLQYSEEESEDISGFNNNTEYKILDYRTAFYLLKNKGLFQFNAGPSLHYYQSKATMAGDLNKFLLSPDVRLTLKFSNMHSIEFSYNQKMVLPSAEDLIMNEYIKSYRSVTMGRLKASNYSTYHQFNGQYMIFDAFSNTMFSAGAFYLKKVNPTSVRTNNGIDFSSQMSVVVPFEETFGGMVYFDKKLRKVPLMFRFNSMYNQSFGYNYVQNDLNGITQKRVNSSGSLTTSFNFLFNVEAGISAVYSNSKSNLAALKNSFYSYEPFVKLQWYQKSGFSGYLSFSKLSYQSDIHQIPYKIVSSVFRYTKKNIEISAEFSNLLNLNNYYGIDTQLQENFYQERQFSILPGYAILRLKYTLKGMNK